MPKAVISLDANQKITLKSCPGAFVALRRMSYGQKLQRATLGMETAMRGEGKHAELSMQMMQRRVAEYEFGHCIVEHNLEDENGKLLNFKDGAVFDRLDPRIGEEISEAIERMNNFDQDQDLAGN